MDKTNVVEGTYVGILYYRDLLDPNVWLSKYGHSMFQRGHRYGEQMQRMTKPIPDEWWMRESSYGTAPARVFVTNTGEVFQYFENPIGVWYYARTPLETLLLP